MALLEMQQITKEFPGVKALDGVTMDLHAGEFHSLVGENGAGKSHPDESACQASIRSALTAATSWSKAMSNISKTSAKPKTPESPLFSRSFRSSKN